MPAASLREEGPQRREQCLNIDFVFVAVVAFVVPWRAYRLQDHTQDSSDEQEFNDLIEKLQEQLANPMAQRLRWRTPRRTTLH